MQERKEKKKTKKETNKEAKKERERLNEGMALVVKHLSNKHTGPEIKPQYLSKINTYINR